MTATVHDRRAPLELELPVEPDSVGRARHALAELAREAGADPEDVALAVSEAVSNAVLHAFPAGGRWGRSPPAPARSSGRAGGGRAGGRIDIRAFEDGDGFVLCVSDDGVGVRPNPDSPGLGLGLALIGSLTERLELRGGDRGTTLVMRFPRAG